MEEKYLHVGKPVYSGCMCVHMYMHTVKQIYMYLTCTIFSKHFLRTKHTDPSVDLEGEKMTNTFLILKFLTI